MFYGGSQQQVANEECYQQPNDFVDLLRKYFFA